MGIEGKVRGIVFAILLFLSSTLGSFAFGGFLLPVFPFNPSLYRHLFDYCIGSWLCYCAVGNRSSSSVRFALLSELDNPPSEALLELFLGIRPVISGDPIRPDEGNLLIMNHRTRLDWMYLWQLLVRQSGVRTEKIILKAPLKHIPGAGWAMQIAGFIFLDRKWETDKTNLATMLDYYDKLSLKAQVLIFPEGTNLSEHTLKRSHEFAEKNNLQPFNNVLHPRVTGFTYITEHMRNNGQLSAVYDITVGYPKNFPVTEPELILGNFPPEVHFHVQRFNIEDLPANEQGLQEWCRQRWHEKEERLANFAKHKSFTATEKAAGDNNNEPVAGNAAPSRDGNTYYLLLCTAIVWTVFILMSLYLLYESSIARWLAIAHSIYFIYMGKTGGFELFQARYFLKNFVKDHRKEK